MHDGPPWRDLHRTRDFREASMVVTCLAAMEFDATLVDGRGRQVTPEIIDDIIAPFIVRVPVADAEMLAEVLQEIIAEQRHFDEMLGAGHERKARNERQMLLALIAIVGALAAFGVIEL